MIATGIEGIQDAVIEGVTGHLVAEMDARAFAAAIIDPKIDPEGIIPAVIERFDWNNIALLYQQEFEHLQQMCVCHRTLCVDRSCKAITERTI